MEDQLTRKVIGAAIEIHKELGPGLLESVYRNCLVYELKALQLRVDVEVILPVYYKGSKLESYFRMDLVVEDKLILELKTVEKILSVHKAQILSYLKMSNKPQGLLINFNVPMLKQGIKRFVN